MCTVRLRTLTPSLVDVVENCLQQFHQDPNSKIILNTCNNVIRLPYAWRLSASVFTNPDGSVVHADKGRFKLIIPTNFDIPRSELVNRYTEHCTSKNEYLSSFSNLNLISGPVLYWEI